MKKVNVIILAVVVLAVVAVNILLVFDTCRLHDFAKVTLATVEAYGNDENFPVDPSPGIGRLAARKVTSNYYEYIDVFSFDSGGSKCYQRTKMAVTEINCPGSGEVACAQWKLYGESTYVGIVCY